jgi:hypothetical protein
MLDIIVVMITIIVAAITAVIAAFEIRTSILKGIIYAFLVLLLGCLSAGGLIPMFFFWAVAGGFIARFIALKGKNNKPLSVGLLIGFMIAFVIIVGLVFVPTHLTQGEKVEVIQLLPQDDVGTLLFGTVSIRSSYNSMNGYSNDVQSFYLYYSNTSPSMQIIDAKTKVLPNEDSRGLIIKYNVYKVYEISPWYYQLFFAGIVDKETVGTFKVIYVPNGTVKMSPEFILMKGSPNASPLFLIVLA